MNLCTSTMSGNRIVELQTVSWLISKVLYNVRPNVVNKLILLTIKLYILVGISPLNYFLMASKCFGSAFLNFQGYPLLQVLSRLSQNNDALRT